MNFSVDRMNKAISITKIGRLNKNSLDTLIRLVCEKHLETGFRNIIIRIDGAGISLNALEISRLPESLMRNRILNGFRYEIVINENNPDRETAEMLEKNMDVKKFIYDYDLDFRTVLKSSVKKEGDANGQSIAKVHPKKQGPSGNASDAFFHF